MSLKLSNIFRNAEFQKLDDKTKLLYLYIVTNPNLSIVGVFIPDVDYIKKTLGFDLYHFKVSIKKLIDNSFIYLKTYNNIPYIILKDYFKNVKRHQNFSVKLEDELKMLPKYIVDFLNAIGLKDIVDDFIFKHPTEDEIKNYSLSKGYVINAKDFISFYTEKALLFNKKDIWVDSKGKEVRDWRAKLRKVWFKDDNKLKFFKEAPKGYEYFYVESITGDIIQPDGWIEGKPYNKDFLKDLELKKVFKNDK